MGKPVRMADIAEKLDISVVSVSKALAGKSGVSEEMRAKVIALARQMGYEGGKVRLDAVHSGNIGVLVADRFFEDNAFYTNLYRSLVIQSGEEGFSCMIEIVSQEAEQEPRLPALAAGRKVDGLVAMGNLAVPYMTELIEFGLPVLLLDFNIPGRAMDCIVSDNVDGGYTLTRHLLDQGYTEIGYVGSLRSTSSIMERYLGYQRALRGAGIVPREEWLLEDRDKDGWFVPFRLPEKLPQAFVCNCDEVAFHFIEALRQRGVRVPEDVAICGYDDYHRFATLANPKLTTYRVDVEHMAAAAVKQLGKKLRQEQTDTLSCIIPGHLVVRESSGASIKGDPVI
ncbi:MAG: LacI family DNA-binding transcriptional regulator [Oscillospiraceae bacterium]|nr:LacI family DNA-binding transcriptional regulator [Oscillospiraceae bacterium]